jgi:glycosyltransferase involved in cell wall biosynthesis
MENAAPSVGRASFESKETHKAKREIPIGEIDLQGKQINMTNPLVSIVIPVHNGSDYLREAMDSALAQTYENLEVIVVDDGSTDGTESVCLACGDRIRYFAKENGGVASALNLGIENMRGEYFSWLSHDDVYFPRKVETQIAALKRDGDMKKIVLGDYDVLHADTGERTSIVLKEASDESLLENSAYPVVRGLIGGCALLIHRSHFGRVGSFDERLQCVQDYDLWFRMFRGQKHLYASGPTYTQRMHGGQDRIRKEETLHREEIGLWKGYVDKLTDGEMSEMYGSKFLFLFEMQQRIRRYDASDNELTAKLREESDARRIPEKMKRAIRVLCHGKDLSICVFGAGNLGLRTHRLLRFCGVSTYAFIDNDPRKHGSEIADGVPCKSFEDAQAAKDAVLVVVAVLADADALAQLRDADFPFVVRQKDLNGMIADAGGTARASENKSKRKEAKA